MRLEYLEDQGSILSIQSHHQTGVVLDQQRREVTIKSFGVSAFSLFYVSFCLETYLGCDIYLTTQPSSSLIFFVRRRATHRKMGLVNSEHSKI